MRNSKPKYKKIAVTGGPCAGKTTFLNLAKEKLLGWGIEGAFPQESATIIINSGLSPKKLLERNDDSHSQMQELIAHTLLHFEDFIAPKILAIKKSEKGVIICDRGLPDVKAYMKNPKDFPKLLKKLHIPTMQAWERYDAGIFLVTAADGKPEFYSKENNPARYENVKEALENDQKIRAAWNGHPHLIIVDNSTLFNAKMKKALRGLQRVLGIPVSLEIERKFLLPAMPDLSGLPNMQKTEIEQVYLKSKGKPGEERVRKRSRDGGSTFYRTFKTASAVKSVREEREEQITEREYQRLVRCEANPDHDAIRKDRFTFIHNNQYFELDLFKYPKRLADLALLEIELTDVNDKVNLPAWLGEAKEVTSDKRYSNYNLSQKP